MKQKYSIIDFFDDEDYSDEEIMELYQYEKRKYDKIKNNYLHIIKDGALCMKKQDVLLGQMERRYGYFIIEDGKILQPKRK